MFACYSRTIYTLPLDILCLRTALAFKVPLPLPSKHLCLQRSFAVVEGPLPSKGLCHRRALPSKCLCNRRGFAFKRHLSSKGLFLQSLLNCRCDPKVFSIEWLLPSMGLCHRKSFGFKVALPLPSKGRRLQRAFAIEES
jgi:hypothetical protein